MLLAIVLIFSVGYLNSFAYASPFEDCNVKDCGAAIPGQLRPNTSSFPYASWDMHQRNATYDFYCDNCNNYWFDNITTNEYHEFVNKRCECGYVAH